MEVFKIRHWFIIIAFVFVSCKKDKISIQPIKESSLTDVMIPSHYIKKDYYEYTKSYKYYESRDHLNFYKDTIDDNYLIYKVTKFDYMEIPLKDIEEGILKKNGSLKKIFEGENHIIYLSLTVEKKLDDEINNSIFRSNKIEFRYYSYAIISKKEKFYLQINFFLNNFKEKKINDIKGIIYKFYN
jgi:hypothetical protein